MAALPCAGGILSGRQVSMNQGFFYCRSWEGGLYMTIDAVFSVLAGVMFLNEQLTWRLFVGGGMILCGVLVVNLIGARRTGFHYGERELRLEVIPKSRFPIYKKHKRPTLG